MSDTTPKRSVILIIEETVQTVYEITEGDPESHFILLAQAEHFVMADDRRPVPEVLAKYVAKGGEPPAIPATAKVLASHTRLAKVTDLYCEDGVPHSKIIRTPSTITSGPIKPPKKAKS